MAKNKKAKSATVGQQIDEALAAKEEAAQRLEVLENECNKLELKVTTLTEELEQAEEKRGVAEETYADAELALAELLGEVETALS